MTELVNPEGLVVGLVLSFPAVRSGIDGTLSMDAVLVRFLLAVLGASLVARVVRSLLRTHGGSASGSRGRQPAAPGTEQGTAS